MLKKDLKRVISGKQAKSRGANFEAILEREALRYGWKVIPILMGCKQVSATKIIKARNPFDFVFIRKGKVIFCDAKTTKTSAFGYTAIKEHQLKALLDCENEGQTAGYIVNFTSNDITVFFSAGQLDRLQPRQSLKPGDGVVLGLNSIIKLDRLFTTHGDGEIL